MFTGKSTLAIPNAIDISPITPEEAFTLLETEFGRFLRVLDTLNAEDWVKPTACTAWTVRDMLAHQAGGYASGTSYREMIRQYSVKIKPGQLPEDATNELQLSERTSKSPDELIAELRTVGPTAIQKWAYQFRFAKLLTRLFKVPHPVSGTISFQYLMWVIHSRDTWMHRLDICRATNRHFEQTVEHDGRIAALVMLDVAKILSPRLRDRAIVFDLYGMAGGIWLVGSGEAAATVRMDVLDFNIFASGRFTYEEALRCADTSGDTNLAETVLKNMLILY